MKPTLTIAARAGQLFHLAGGLRVPGIFLLLTGFFTFTAGNFFEGEKPPGCLLRLAPWLYLVLVPAVGMRLWPRSAARHARALLPCRQPCRRSRQVPSFVGVPGVALALTFPTSSRRNIPRRSGQRPESSRAIWAACSSRRLSRHRLHDLGDDAQPGGRFHPVVVLCLFLILAGFNPVTDLPSAGRARRGRHGRAFSVVTHFDGSSAA